MTRDEIDELITYLEKNYYVECELVTIEHLGKQGLVVTPTLQHRFVLDSNLIKQIIINRLDKSDLIRF